MRKTLPALVSVVFSAALILTPSDEVHAQGFQRLRIPMGTFRIRGGPTRIPGFCVDSTRSLPSRSDVFRGASDSIKFARVRGNQTLSEVPLRQAIRENLVRVKGLDDLAGFSVEPVRLEPGVEFEIRARSSGLIASTDQDLLEGEKKIQTSPDSLQTLDQYNAELRSVFGENSALERDFHDQKSMVEWALTTADPESAQKVVAAFFTKYKGSFSSIEPEELTRRLSLLSGKPLGPDQVKALRSKLGFNVKETQYDNNIKKRIEQYNRLEVDVLQAFGSSDKYTDDIFSILYRNAMAGKAYEDVIKDIKDYLPIYAADSSVAGDVLALERGERLTSQQAEVLSRVTGYTIRATGELLNHHLLIEEKSGGLFALKTISSSKTVKSTDFDSELRKQLALTPIVVISSDFKLNEAMASKLSKAKVKLVRTLDHVANEANDLTKEMVPVFVLSQKPEEIRQLFNLPDDADVSKIVKAVKTLEELNIGKFAPTKEKLESVLRNLGPEQKPIVIFNSVKGGINFEVRLNLLDLRDLPGKPDALACNTFEFADRGLLTTDFVYIDELGRALKKMQDQSRQHQTTKKDNGNKVPPGGNNPPPPGDGFDFNAGGWRFYQTFNEAYGDELRRSKVKQEIWIVLLVSAAGQNLFIFAKAGIGGSTESSMNGQGNDDDEKERKALEEQKKKEQTKAAVEPESSKRNDAQSKTKPLPDAKHSTSEPVDPMYNKTNK